MMYHSRRRLRWLWTSSMRVPAVSLISASFRSVARLRSTSSYSSSSRAKAAPIRGGPREHRVFPRPRRVPPCGAGSTERRRFAATALSPGRLDGPCAATHRKRLDAVEDTCDARFRVPEHQALRQHIGNYLQPFERGCFDDDGARPFDLVFPAPIDPHLHLVGLRGFERLVNPCPQ